MIDLKKISMSYILLYLLWCILGLELASTIRVFEINQGSGSVLTALEY